MELKKGKGYLVVVVDTYWLLPELQLTISDKYRRKI